MDIFVTGIQSVLTWEALLILVIGVVWGCVAGVMPGMSLILALTLALPFTYTMPVQNALVLIVGIAAGEQFGNGLTAIALGIPGSSSAVITVIEGFSLLKRGRGGEALFLNLLAAAFGQLIGALGFVMLIVPLTGVAPHFLSPEIFALTIFALLAVASITAKNLLKGTIAAMLGLAISTVGLDPVSSQPRFMFGSTDLISGFDVVPVTIGILGLGEVLYQVYRGAYRHDKLGTTKVPSIGRVWMSPKKLAFFLPAALFAAGVGFFVGVIPGMGAVGATFIVYQQLKLVARNKAELGKGSAEGLVAQNVADNIVIGGELVPTLGLGIPASPSMTVLMGALLIQGIEPGPMVLQTRPELTGSVAAAFFVAGLVLLPVGWVFSYYSGRLSRIWPPAVAGSAVVLILLGAFSVREWSFDLYAILAFGVLGFLMRVFNFPVAAIAIGFILGNGLESSFRHGLLISSGNYATFFGRPVAASILSLAVVLVLAQWLWSRRARRRAAALPVQASPAQEEPAPSVGMSGSAGS